MFYDGWYPLLTTLVSGVVAYVLLILLLRLCGKRTLSKWNAFDYVVTIALGSTLATILLSKDITIVQGVTGLVICPAAVCGHLVIGPVEEFLEFGESQTDFALLARRIPKRRAPPHAGDG
ncbi:MAG: hypothetical protein ABIU29_04550 [Chthoniobacterales bacterium]